MRQVPLTVGSTFTGIGAADLGLEWAGYKIAWQCERDDYKQSVLRAHWPDVELYDDITTLTDPASVDLMIGGFPCQDLSVAGKRKGFDGQRSVLAFEFLRVAESLAPRWLILENVPGLLSSNRGRDFARLVDEMVDCGYGVAWRILDARYFGVPQRRRRVFIVARRADAGFDTRTASRLALRALLESGSGDSTPCDSPGTYYPSTPEGSSHARGYRASAQFGQWVEDKRSVTLNQRDYKSPKQLISFYATGGSQEGFARTDEIAPTMKRGSTLDIAAPPAVAFRNVANALDRQSGGPDDNAALSGHIVSSDSMTLRRLTPVECERLMGLPDGWTAPAGVKASDSKRYAACGDAIVTTVAYWIGQRINMIEEETR